MISRIPGPHRTPPGAGPHPDQDHAAFAHLSHDTLLDATNSVNTALGGMFVPMVSANPATQLQVAAI